jgi:hypothetical protein
MKVLGRLIVFSLVSFLMVSCGGNQKTKTYSLNDIEFVYEGPLFEGSNPAQYIAKVDLKAIFKEDFKEGMSIEKVVLKKADVIASDASMYDGISSLVLSLSADNPEIKMQELAVLNPVEKGITQAVLKPSLKADAADFFSEKQFYIVLDATLSKDIEMGLNLKGNFEFELSYK